MPDAKHRPTLLEKLERLEAEVARGLLKRLRLRYIERFLPERIAVALFTLVNGFITIAILAAVAMASDTPFIFPSLGPTAFLYFFNPTAAAASPRNALCGHALGIVCGFGALWLVGLHHAPPATAEGITGARVVAVALSLALTGALMILLDVVHPPAGATTLIVSLGIVSRPYHLAIIEVAVALLTLQAIGINRLAGIDYPLWNPRRPQRPPGRNAGLGDGRGPG